MINLKGIKLGSYVASFDGVTPSARAIYIVEGIETPDPFKALDVPGLPEIGKKHPIRNDIEVLNHEATLVDDTNNIAEIAVTWGLKTTATIGPASTQQVQWDISTGTANTQVGRNGLTMGFSHFFRSVDPLRRSTLRDENADIGFEYLAPQIEAQVTRPIPSQFIPTNSFPLVGKVNDRTFVCDGVQFAPREALLAAISARRLSPAPANQYEIGYRFLFGRSQLPLGLPVFLNGTGDPVTQSDIPLGDGYKTMFRPLKTDNQIARSLEETTIREPIGVAVYQIYHEGNFNVLGVT